MNWVKDLILGIVGLVGSGIAYIFGGWNEAMITLIIFMAIDYITGLMVAGIFRKSQKTKNGGLESRAGFKGLCRKFAVLLLVAVGYQLDRMIGVDYIKNTVIIAFVANEALSITENMALMGIPMPNVIKKAIEVLKSKEKE